MLSASARLTKSHEFRCVIRRGRRAGRSRLVVHVLRPEAARPDRVDAFRQSAGSRDDQPLARQEFSAGKDEWEANIDTAPTRERDESTRVGFIVSKAVGNAVVRHRVTRRLRHLMRDRIDLLPAGTLVVVRALRPAASADSRQLGADLDAAFRKLGLLGYGPTATGEHRPTDPL